MEFLCISYLCIGVILALCVVGIGLIEELSREKNPVHRVITVLISGAISVVFAFIWFPVLCNVMIRTSRPKRSRNVKSTIDEEIHCLG